MILFIIQYTGKEDSKGNSSQCYVASESIETAIEDFKKSEIGQKAKHIDNIERSMYPIIFPSMPSVQLNVLRADTDRGSKQSRRI